MMAFLHLTGTKLETQFKVTSLVKENNVTSNGRELG